MSTKTFSLSLDRSEERLAQLLTRDAWNYFSSLISQRELFHVKDIPMMPRRGCFEIPDDPDIIQYYLEFTSSYTEELLLLGWTKEEISSAEDSFVKKIEDATGYQRNESRRQASVVA
jgi:hypothetical protein